MLDNAGTIEILLEYIKLLEEGKLRSLSIDVETPVREKPYLPFSNFWKEYEHTGEVILILRCKGEVPQTQLEAWIDRIEKGDQ